MLFAVKRHYTLGSPRLFFTRPLQSLTGFDSYADAVGCAAALLFLPPTLPFLMLHRLMLSRPMHLRRLAALACVMGMMLLVDIAPSVAQDYGDASSSVQVFLDSAVPLEQRHSEQGAIRYVPSHRDESVIVFMQSMPKRQTKPKSVRARHAKRHHGAVIRNYAQNIPAAPVRAPLLPPLLNPTVRQPLVTMHVAATTDSPQLLRSAHPELEESVRAQVAEKMNEGRRRPRLLPVLTTEVPTPLQMATIQTADLSPPVLPRGRQQSGSNGRLTSPVLSPALKVTAATPETCVDNTTPWVRSCADAGYPVEFGGEIRGETRTVCATNEMHDIWLSNSCAPGGMPVLEPAAAATKTEVLTVRTPDEQSMSAAVDVTPTDGACGDANGTTAIAAPHDALCQSGFASPVSGTDSWRWSCLGRNGGMTVSCAATASPEIAVAGLSSRNPINGKCGASDQAGMSQTPAAGLCATGDASAVNGTGPWNWACSGANGGHAVVCQALVRDDGQCGYASGVASSDLPVLGLCAAGEVSKVASDGKGWKWNCAGKNGGLQLACAAPKQNPGQCGTAAQAGHAYTPEHDLCSVGTASVVEGGGPWRWNCSGENGGTIVNCAAPITMNAQCGQAHGLTTSQAPRQNLCAKGQASAVDGTGPWEWSCMGQDGGMTVSCAAPVGADVVPALPSVDNVEKSAAADTDSHKVATKNAHKAASETFGADLPDAVPTMPVESQALIPASIETDAHSNATATMCGLAASGSAVMAPISDLCAKGIPGAVTGDGPWVWVCTDDNEKTENCATRMPVLAECGAAHGLTLDAMPTQDLCAAGSSSMVRGDGPWLWVCDGGSGGTQVQCAAQAAVSKQPPHLPHDKATKHGKHAVKAMPKKLPKAKKSKVAAIAQTTQNTAPQVGLERDAGVCGAAVNAPHKTKPESDLCQNGVADKMNGNGPWAWVCRGTSTGKSVTCVAQAQMEEKQPTPIDGACGGATKTEAAATPANDLCATGLPSQVNGTGPWAWTCGGVNGGLAVTCTAQMAAQAPPPKPDAPRVDGICGKADGVAAPTQPNDDLCAKGILSTMRGTGPWHWDCVGGNGGDTASCSAQKIDADQPPPTRQPFTRSDNAADKAAADAGNLVTPQLSLPPVPALVAPATLPPPPVEAPVTIPSPPPMLEMPKLDRPLPKIPSNDLMPGTDNYAPTPPVRAPGAAKTKQPLVQVIDPEHASITFASGSEVLNETADAVVMAVGKKLAANPGARIGVTAYADLHAAGNDTREARRISLARALAVRDTLLANGATEEQIKIRAQGANVPSGNADRVDLADR
jgi:outer membrane protein OmpA-like peptidoglycan-associated protein